MSYFQESIAKPENDIYALAKTIAEILSNCIGQFSIANVDLPPWRSISEDAIIKQNLSSGYPQSILDILDACTNWETKPPFQDIEQFRQELIPALAEAWGVTLQEEVTSPLPPASE